MTNKHTKGYAKAMNDNKKLSIYPSMLRFITEISEALGDKMKGGKSLSVLETSMYVQANEILKQIK